MDWVRAVFEMKQSFWNLGDEVRKSPEKQQTEEKKMKEWEEEEMIEWSEKEVNKETVYFDLLLRRKRVKN